MFQTKNRLFRNRFELVTQSMMIDGKFFRKEEAEKKRLAHVTFTLCTLTRIGKGTIKKRKQQHNIRFVGLLTSIKIIMINCRFYGCYFFLLNF